MRRQSLIRQKKFSILMALAIEALGTVGFPARVAKVVDLIR
jgi:hypothetical protein